MSRRRASHSGSWYLKNGDELNEQLEFWLNQTEFLHGPARAIIAPHAGFQYSGQCASHAYRQIDPSIIRNVFILGPSHHVRLADFCALTKTEVYETPIYDLKVNVEVVADLESTGEFEAMSIETDENEHSIEMHLPFIAKIMENHRDQFKVIPILVGSLSPQREHFYGRIFSKFLTDPTNLFVISSDFCHWGTRFRYVFYDKNRAGEIWEGIERLDREAMHQIESLQPENFHLYLKKTGNTICGRHPISIFLHAVRQIQEKIHKKSDETATEISEKNQANHARFRGRIENCDSNYHENSNEYTSRNCDFNRDDVKTKFVNFKFIEYKQSSKVRNFGDSSVSYAAGSLVIN